MDLCMPTTFALPGTDTAGLRVGVPGSEYPVPAAAGDLLNSA